ncbi:MAG: hypothetical protein ABSE22_14780 [Xanthobacteraceae bacterium]|jgi:hypothetical protein
MKSLIASTMIFASLALAANAFAADNQANAATKMVHARVATHAVAKPVVTKHAVPRRTYAVAPRPATLGQFIQGLFGGGFPLQVARGAGGRSDVTPSYDYSTPADTTPTFDAAQASVDASEENAAIQSMNDTNALNASMAAAEEQNDAANAATLQTEINAGM